MAILFTFKNGRGGEEKRREEEKRLRWVEIPKIILF